jgi:hypothetical protein
MKLSDIQILTYDCDVEECDHLKLEIVLDSEVDKKQADNLRLDILHGYKLLKYGIPELLKILESDYNEYKTSSILAPYIILMKERIEFIKDKTGRINNE